MCSGKEFHNFGDTQLKALLPKELNLKFGTLQRMISKNVKECTTEEDLKDKQEPDYEVK